MEKKLMWKERFKKLMGKWEALTSGQKSITIFCSILLVVLLVVGGIVIALSTKPANSEGTENTQGTEGEGIEEVFMTEETEGTESTEVEEVMQTISVSMTATSIEKDLKIKIVNESNQLIAGQPFVIVVTPDGKETGTEYSDHDMDGIVYIKSIAAGKYMVQLQELEGFVVTQNPITATVKDEIVYEKVEIKNEIKDESQVDVTKEDTSNKTETVESEIKDTLPLLQSSQTADVVTKDKVDFSNFPDAVISGETDFPKTATLYAYGKNSSKTVTLPLNLTGVEGQVYEITWSADKEDVVALTVAEDHNSALLTAKTEGQARVTVEVSYGEAMQTAKFICDVTVGDYTDDKTQIKDVEGNLLFLDNGGKTIATPKDYTAAEKFYTSIKYTGWQTIDGNVYYYKEDHTFVTGRQVIGGVTYDFNEQGHLIKKTQIVGIDVSKWQGDIDWKAVSESGIDFAIIRCGYRGSSSGTLVEDPYFKKNIEGATKNGIMVGVYFYSQAITQAEAIEEASMALELVKGYHLQLPIFIDTEQSNGRGDKISVADRTKFVKVFCETVKNSGYTAGVYAGKDWITNRLNASELEQYHIWVAQYNTECTYGGRYDIWQYTQSGTVPGISGKVDRNIAYRLYY